MILRRVLAVVCLWVLLYATRPGAAADPAPGEPTTPPAVILDTSGFWRMHHVLKPPVVQLDDGLTPALTGIKWLDWETPSAPPDWIEPGFDDSNWVRLPLRRAAATPYLAGLYLRGKFRVTDPSRVRGLKLWVDFYGGAIVYLNGSQIAREKTAVGQTDLAEGYPEEAFVDADGAMLPCRDLGTGDILRRKNLRLRKLEAVPVPPELLRAGVNVLSIKVVRAPYQKVVATLKPMNPDHARHPYDLCWGTCQIHRVQLAADSGEGLVPNCFRRSGFQVWNSDPLAADFDLDFGDDCEELRPIYLVGARNGSYSGKVVVGATDPVVGLKATASDLKAGDGVIPASAVHLRYGIPWGEEKASMPYAGSRPYPTAEHLLGALAESPLKEFPVPVKPIGPYWLNTPNQPAIVLGAVTSVWGTVRIPTDARPGLYRGEITIEAEGAKVVTAPIEVKVLDWSLPDPQDYKTWVEYVQSPETLAVEYGLEPWSARHWEMIGRTFRYLNETGSRVLYIPLLAHTNLGNEHSMVCWIPEADGTYGFDFSIMDKYLDTAEKCLGRPRIVCFVVWDIYLIQTEIDDPRDITANPEAAKARRALAGEGPLVTVLHPGTGEPANVNLPLFTDARSMDIWKPLFSQIRLRMKDRGLEDAMTLGWLSDARPTKEEAQALRDASDGLPWVAHSHHGVGELPIIGKTAYYTHVFGHAYPFETSRFGWTSQRLAAFFRRGDHNSGSVARWRQSAEMQIIADDRGIGRLGADLWPAIKDKNGRRVGNVTARFPESQWRNLELITYFLAPGPDGPVVTNRFEAIREGVQECEARIYLETALVDEVKKGKLGEELASRIKQALDERIQYMWKGNSNLLITYAHYAWGYPFPWSSEADAGLPWYLGSGWQQRSEKLYALAAEVQEKLASEQLSQAVTADSGPCDSPP